MVLNYFFFVFSAVQKVSISFANTTTIFRLPSLSSILEPFLPASVSHQPALAGMPTEMMEESREEISDALEWDGVLNAVPKSKVSHSRKAMRAANKGLKDRVGKSNLQYLIPRGRDNLNQSDFSDFGIIFLLTHRSCSLCLLRKTKITASHLCFLL